MPKDVGDGTFVGYGRHGQDPVQCATTPPGVRLGGEIKAGPGSVLPNSMGEDPGRRERGKWRSPGRSMMTPVTPQAWGRASAGRRPKGHTR